MSLTSCIRNTTGPEMRYFKQEFPDVRAVAQEWRRGLSGAVAIVPTEPIRYDIVGQAIDYRIRFYYAIPRLVELVAFRGMQILCSPLRLQLNTGKCSMGPRAWTECRSNAEGELMKLGIRGPALDFCRDLMGFFRETKLVGRRISADEETELCRYCYVLALFDKFVREGPDIPSPLNEVKPGAGTRTLLSLAPDAAIGDLARLSWLFYDRAWDKIRPGATLNPTFAGSSDVGGADADLIVDGCLTEIKTVKKPEIDARLVYQLLGYCLLDYDDHYRIRSVGVYFARHGVWLAMDLTDFLTQLSDGRHSDLSEARSRFQRVVSARESLPTP